MIKPTYESIRLINIMRDYIDDIVVQEKLIDILNETRVIKAILYALNEHDKKPFTDEDKRFLED